MNKTRKDNNTTVYSFKKQGYRATRIEGQIRATQGYGWDRRLESWYHPGRKDYMTIAHPASIQGAKSAGYVFKRALG